MKVDWNTPENHSPYVFNKEAKWTGIDIHHLRVLPGELMEQTQPLHEVCVTLDGSLRMDKQLANGKWQKNFNKQGNICLTSAEQPFKGRWLGELECLMIFLTPSFVRQTALEQNFSADVEFLENYERRDPLIQHIGMTLLTEANSKESFGRMYAESLAQTLILHLLKNYSTSKPKDEKVYGGLSGFKLRQAKEFINENLEEDLSLSEVAEAVGLSQFHFARAFRKSTGYTPQQYLVKERINRAKELLAKGDLPLVEVSIQAGFKNQSHFTTLFRKFTALTPKAFREAKHR